MTGSCVVYCIVNFAGTYGFTVSVRLHSIHVIVLLSEMSDS